MHYTSSIDYGAMLCGELELLMGNGSSVTCRAGDVLVECGNVHQLQNKTQEPVRKSRSRGVSHRVAKSLQRDVRGGVTV